VTPALAFVVLLILATIGGEVLAQRGREMAPTMLGALVQGHAGDVLHGAQVGIGRWYDAAAKLAGELFPLLFASVAAVAVLRVRSRKAAVPPVRVRSVPVWFSVIAITVFGLIFYVLSADKWSGALYQIYVLLPVILLFLHALERMEATRAVELGVLGVAVFSALLGQLAYVWRLPTYIRPAYAIELHGTNHPENGAQAAGLLVREALSASRQAMAADFSTTRIQVREYSVDSVGFPNTPYLVAAGLHNNGEWLRFAYGFRGTVTVERLQRLHASDCGTVGCLDVELPGQETARYELFAGNALRAVVTLRAPVLSPEFPSGSYEIDELNRKFAKRYNRITDFFPHQPRELRGRR
jgi:hypothetical protein